MSQSVHLFEYNNCIKMWQTIHTNAQTDILVIKDNYILCKWGFPQFPVSLVIEEIVCSGKPLLLRSRRTSSLESAYGDRSLRGVSFFQEIIWKSASAHARCVYPTLLPQLSFHEGTSKNNGLFIYLLASLIWWNE